MLGNLHQIFLQNLYSTTVYGDELEDALLEKFLKWFPQFQVEGDGKISL